MSTGFWDNKKIASSPANIAATQAAEMAEQAGLVLDEEAVLKIQEEAFDVFEDEEEDTQSLMSDANLRLEQGRLYQMVLQGNIFENTNADPKAIRNVQREIRKFVRERMETMLGIRQEQLVEQVVVSSPFNDMEVMALKMIASKVTKGASEEAPRANTPMPETPPKKDGISSISGSLRPNVPLSSPGTPLRKEAKAALKPQQIADRQVAKQSTKPPSPRSALVKEDEPLLTKPIDEMTPQELAEHNKVAEERSARKRAAIPNNLVPHPTPQQLEMMYTGMTQNLNISGMRPYRLE